MNYDSFVLAAVARELEALSGAFVDQIYQPDERTVLLALAGGGRRLLLLSVDPRHARAHLLPAAKRPASPTPPPGFCMLLRKHLRGGRLQAAEQPGFDRVLRLRISRSDGERALVHEIMGRHANLALVDPAGVVLGGLKRLPADRSRVRRLLPGEPYTPPPGERLDPRVLTEAEFRAEFGEEPVTPERLIKTLSGFGPCAARELLARAAEPSAAALWPAFQELMQAVGEGRFEPTLLVDEAGEPLDLWAFPSRQWPAERQRRRATMSDAVEAALHQAARTQDVEARRKALRTGLERRLRALRARREEAARQIEGREAAEELRERGELLVAAPEAGRGAEEALVPDYYHPEGEPRRIPLDPLLTRRENAEAYFRRYRRAVSAAEGARERLPQVERELAALEAELAELEAAPPEALPEPPPGRAARPGPQRQEREFPAGVRIKRLDVDGWEVLLGENATGNDYLTTRVARPDDLWLHARAVTGAHVVVRGARSVDRVPPAVLREAARLAAANSDARHSSLVLVDYTLRRYVRKPRGAPPGTVTYQREKTLRVEPAS